jgi:DNA-3-methyladenine glycosylase II
MMTSEPARLTVRFAPPLDLAASLEPFRRWGDDLLDRWDGSRLLRTSHIDGRTIAWRAEIAGTAGEPALDVVTRAAEADRTALGQAIRGTFIAAPASWPPLLRRDPILADLDRRWPGLRPVLVPDLFTGLVRSISAQQVNLRWAATTRRRLAETFGDRLRVAGEDVYTLSAARVADATVEQIRALQFTTSKARSIVAVARAFATGEVDPAALREAPDEEVIATLIGLRGIGRWSAEWILARTFGRPVVVAGDLGVRKAVGRLYLGLRIASELEVRRATAHWGDAAAIAQALALRSLVDPA